MNMLVLCFEVVWCTPVQHAVTQLIDHAGT